MADVGLGAAIAFGTTTNFTAVCESIQMGLGSRESIETSHLGTTSRKTFIPSELVDSGELTCTCQYDPHVAHPPISGAVETITITLPRGSGKTASSTYACAGFITEAGQAEFVKEDLARNDITIKFTGVPTHTIVS